MKKDFKVSWPLSKAVLEANNEFWLKKSKQKSSASLTKTLKASKSILPTHTFAYKRDGIETLKSIFGYDAAAGQFNPDCDGIISKSLRDGSHSKTYPEFGHMKTSVLVGHEIFIFAYHGVHNPHHRQYDDPPVRPFGIFIRKTCESFPKCHGSPCDITTQNEFVDRKQLGKYYLKPSHLRVLKAHEIMAENRDFWHYFGTPGEWTESETYAKNLYKKMGEFRYLNRIDPDEIHAILWPFFVQDVDENGVADMNENLDLYNAFVRSFPNIKVIRYNHDVATEQNWELTLVESSYYCTKYYLEYDRFPDEAKFAKDLYTDNQGKK
jgi:hypothetical protein